MTCPIPQPEQVDFVIYHYACQDGFGAAWAAHQRIGDTSPKGVEIQYVSAKYGSEPPDVTGRHVAIVDFCYEREQLDAMVEKAASLVVLDHHKSNRERLEGGGYVWKISVGDEHAFVGADGWEGALASLKKTAGNNMPSIERLRLLPFENAVFNMDKSGAMLSWEFFHPGVCAPRLIEHLQDRDLWRFELPDTKRVQAWLDKEKMDFEKWTEAAETLDHKHGDEGLERFLSDADVVLRYAQSLHRRLAKHAHPATLRTPLGELRVKMMNTCYFQSDICHEILDGIVEDPEGDPNMVAMAWFYDEKTQAFRCSLRSHDDRPAVDVHAKAFGGGGHRNAAGFEVRALVPLPVTPDEPEDG